MKNAERYDLEGLPLRARMGAAQVYRRTKINTGQPLAEVISIFRAACADMELDPDSVYRTCQRAELPATPNAR
jgi:hypothetical protein